MYGDLTLTSSSPSFLTPTRFGLIYNTLFTSPCHPPVYFTRFQICSELAAAMGEKKVTVMVLKVDLQCSKCYKKVKKVLCKFPQIQDQIYDEKQNKVIIKVVCCNPERIRDKLCCKGDGSIKSIEILEPKPPEKPKEPEKPKQPEKPKEPEKPKQPEKPKEPEKPKQPEKPKEPEKPKQPEKPKEPEKPKQPEKPKEPEKPKDPPKPNPTPAPPPVVPVLNPEPCYPPVPNPGRTCCRECYEGRRGGPCYELGHGQVRYYDGYCGRPVYDSWGGGGGYGCNTGYYKSRCTDYICEENPNAACTIM
ncbi:pollen-specific leucine-rich repeat extensin-like protein 1 isoform X1 [Melia azedarach]|uniref:Pollen-specific leucine-rich repeat extensin-like protein 1 isoform X1 n=1 Tax=Melia azedarach TaxID=155640 RepID=A0ACC1WXZ3_MELAZ|nr:pollen-specific leucine-rich repeat extensin-like protein 1 isoform X1 [Melia azedarach]